MSNQNLEFNTLPFDWPKGNIILYINGEEQAKIPRLHKRQFPYDIETYLPGIMQPGQNFIATSFDRPMKGFFPIVIDPRTDNPDNPEILNSHIYPFHHAAQAHFYKIQQYNTVRSCLVYPAAPLYLHSFVW